jgi:hypothetical protein
VSDESGPPRYVSGSRDVKAIVMFKDALFSLANDGVIRLLSEDPGHGQGEWIDIGYATQKLLADADHLFALTYNRGFFGENRGVWVYKGQPDGLSLRFIPILMPYSCATGLCYNVSVSPWVRVRGIAFENARIPEVMDLIKRDGVVLAVTPQGVQSLSLTK